MALVPSRPAVPWWVLAIAASFLAYLILIFVCEIHRAEPFGVQGHFGERRLVVVRVAPGSLAERVGLRPGDVIVASGGRPVFSRLHWMALDANIEIGRPFELVVERDGARLRVTPVPGRMPWRAQLTREAVALRAIRLVQTVTVIVAIFLAVRRPRDPVAMAGAALLATMGVFSVVLPYGIAAVWRSLPLVIALPLFIPFVGSLAVPFLLFAFFALFPRTLFRSRLAWTIVSIPAVASLAWHVLFAYRMVYTPERITDVPNWLEPFIVSSGIYVLGALAVLVVNYRRLEDVNEKRRVRVLVLGLLLGMPAGTLVVLRSWVGGGAQLQDSFLGSSMTLTGTLLFLALPLSFEYAILRHRLFDVSLIIRQGLRYALARRLLFSLAPAVVALLAIDLLLHGNQPLVATLRARGWIYASLGAVLVTTNMNRRRWKQALDRRFFRERYNAQQLLHRVADDLREGGDVGRMAPRVAAQIEAALHPAFVALLARGAGEREYRQIAVAPGWRTTRTLPVDSKVMGLLRLLRKPLQVSLTESGWLRQLPEDEVALLYESGTQLLVPVPMDPDRGEALIVLGEKRSEEPYSGEDYDLLGAIAGSLALVLDRDARSRPGGATTFEECPQCGVCYDAGTGRCHREGAELNIRRLPRLLANRYRLEHRLGSGGMGTVYAATDTALERPVAAKLVREDLFDNPDAAERFEAEARIAASFAHPNVVTVHDFGVVRDGHRAFLIMELLSGRTLRDALRAEGRLPPERAVAVFRDVCAGVQAAHRRNLVHRDLKPENIFLPEGDQPAAKVLDFGIAKLLRARTATSGETGETGAGILLGTLQYMAPEQLRGDHVHPSWDLWALAVAAYETLTGAHPFAGAGLPGGLRGHGTAISLHLATTPVAWQQFFTIALAPDAASRPASAQALFDGLEQAVSR